MASSCVSEGSTSQFVGIYPCQYSQKFSKHSLTIELLSSCLSGCRKYHFSVQALEWAAQRVGGVTDSGGVQRAFGCCVEGHGLAGTIDEGRMVGLGDPVGLFQP